MAKDKMKELVAMCKRRGFVFQGSEIYGGLEATYDFGPMGAELKKNIKDHWWKYFVTAREDMVGMDSSIFMNPETWNATGHLTTFNDPQIDCKKCKARYRADNLIENKLGIVAEGKQLEEMTKIIKESDIKCEKCGSQDWTDVKKFNLMFKTVFGATQGSMDVYLRPETAQGIFVNFNNVLDSTRVRIPFGIAQIGKAFRNEVVARNFIFRTREFEQMEIEYFCKPGEEDDTFDQWNDYVKNWFYSLGLKKDNLKIKMKTPPECAFYSKITADYEYNFPWGFDEILGIASRTDYDLSRHNEHSGKSLQYTNQSTKESFIPYVIEPSFGVERMMLVFMLDAFNPEEEVEGSGKRSVLKLHKELAPIKIAVFPLKKNDDEFVNKAKSIFHDLKFQHHTVFDNTGNIGKNYRRQDEIGTPYCITVDHDTIKTDNKVTVRDRDTMQQDRILVDNLKDYFYDKFKV
jgi:glycyl-tRNA synthetase